MVRTLRREASASRIGAISRALSNGSVRKRGKGEKYRVSCLYFVALACLHMRAELTARARAGSDEGSRSSTR